MVAFGIKDELWERRAKSLDNRTTQVNRKWVQEAGAGSGPQACSVETGAATSSSYANAFKRQIICHFGELRTKTGEFFLNWTTWPSC